MGEELIFSKSEVTFLQELIRQKVRFMVVGLGAAALQGAPVVTQDVDLWFCDLGDAGIQAALRKVGGAYVPPVAMNPPTFAGPGVSLFDIVTHMHGLDSFDEEMSHTIKVGLGRFKLNVLSLDRIIASKKAIGREKDKLVLPVLEDVWKTRKAVGQEGA